MPALVLRVRLGQASRDLVHVPLRLRDGDARFEAPDESQEVEAARGRFRGVEADRPPDLYVDGPLERRRHDPDNGERTPVDRDRFANDARISAESALPETVRDDRDRARSDLFLRQKRSAAVRLDA